MKKACYVLLLLLVFAGVVYVAPLTSYLEDNEIQHRYEISQVRDRYLRTTAAEDFYRSTTNPALAKIIYPLNWEIIYPRNPMENFGVDIAEKAKLAFQMAIQDHRFSEFIEVSYQYYTHAFKRNNYRSEDKIYYLATAAATNRLQEAKNIAEAYIMQIQYEIKHKTGRFYNGTNGHYVVPLIAISVCDYVEHKLIALSDLHLNDEKKQLVTHLLDEIRVVCDSFLADVLKTRVEAVEDFLKKKSSAEFEHIANAQDYKIEMTNLWDLARSSFFVFDGSRKKMIIMNYDSFQIFKLSGGGRSLYVCVDMQEWQDPSANEMTLLAVENKQMLIQYRYERDNPRFVIGNKLVNLKFVDVNILSKMSWCAEYIPRERLSIYTVSSPGKFQGAYITDGFSDFRFYLVEKINFKH